MKSKRISICWRWQCTAWRLSMSDIPRNRRLLSRLRRTRRSRRTSDQHEQTDPNGGRSLFRLLSPVQGGKRHHGRDFDKRVCDMALKEFNFKQFLLQRGEWLGLGFALVITLPVLGIGVMKILGS